MAKIKASSPRNPFYRKSTYVVLTFVLFIIGAGIYWKYVYKKVTVLPSVGSSVTQPTSAQPGTGSQSTTTENVSPKSTTNGTGGTGGSMPTNDLKAPYGSFVSNHKPDSGDPEVSVCSTTPGATCYIEFTNGNNVKRLEPQTVSGEGSTYWSWNASLLGEGTWKITAVATLNGATKSTTDQLTIEVRQK